MSVCRLCLNSIEGTVPVTDFQTIKAIHKILPRLHNVLRKNPVICDICCDNIGTAEKLQKANTETDQKIRNELRRLKVAKINLRGFHQNVCNDVSVCRICLNLINVPKLFLCANSRNVLEHDIIKHMLKFCNINVNINLSDRPVICINCWENLQITYTFKKGYIEVEKKIGVFCQIFKHLRKNISPEILQKVHNYYSEEYCEIMSCNIKKEEDYYLYMFPKIKTETCTYKMSTPIKDKSKGEMRYVGDMSDIPPKILKFSKSDNFTLMRVYYEVTDNEQNFPAGYWKQIAAKWEERMPKRKIPLDKLDAQINKVFSKALISEADLLRIKRDVELQRATQYSCTNTQTYNTNQMSYQNEESEFEEEDSDDSFEEADAGQSSFPQHVKTEILNESDIEFNSIETKLEVESDCESLPQLERMDIPPMNFKIENICSLEVKREAFDQYMMQEEMHNDDEDLNKSRRKVRAHRSGVPSDIIKCGECNFETRFRWCAERHKMYHQKGRHKMHQCPNCPYRISNKWRFKRHVRSHRADENDIPILEPFMIPLD